MAPGAKYSKIVDSIFKGYLFIFNYLTKYLEIDDFKFIFLGDSAGATLIMALTNWIILNDLKMPKCLILNYPAVDLNFT